ncbi:DUF5801 repeats-in-toxin domain-containing protein [Nitrincola sp. A-D6]|uniref:DUF5801 repeats-in-toxin domain-containing protein n=1 Tax=Nitrincola sp. A-D6 TaxID=1545442 RepID=UPI00068B6B3A|nr:DUF5801 repeats-in-toxin domain-containing protein [Nitrincola sp. A-D6]
MWNSDGTRIAYNDDASTALGDGGSSHAFDSYLTYTFATPGTYYISVGQFPGGSNPDNPIPTGGTYQLQVSLTNAVVGGADGVWTTSADFSGNFDVAYGADGPGSVSYALSLAGEQMGSGLFALDPENTTEGELGQGAEIMLSMNGDTIVGMVGDTEYFQIAVDGDTGVVSFTRFENVWHSDTSDHDDAAWLNAAVGSILLTATAIDADGDTSSASLDLSSEIFSIEDDGPTAALAEGLEVMPQLVVDESALPDGGDGIRSDSADFSVYFATGDDIDFGTDGSGSVNYAFVLNTGEGAESVGSGLFALDSTDTSDADGDGIGQGDEIQLSANAAGTVVTGSVGEVVYFTLTLDPESGEIEFEQFANIWHSDTAEHDDAETLLLEEGTLLLQQTVTDADGDSDSVEFDLGAAGAFSIEDDGPTVTIEPAVSYTLAITNYGETSAGYNNSFGYYIKDADGNPTTGAVVWDNVKNFTDSSVTITGYTPDQVAFSSFQMVIVSTVAWSQTLRWYLFRMARAIGRR